jgi:hypothetical protein
MGDREGREAVGEGTHWDDPLALGLVDLEGELGEVGAVYYVLFEW